MSARSDAESAVVAARFPVGTQPLVVGNYRGWLYPVVNELGQPFELFIFFDGSVYRVMVVAPPLEGRHDVSRCHLYSDGSICLDHQVGLPSFEQAYAKSVLWCTGFGLFEVTGTFPFSI